MRCGQCQKELKLITGHATIRIYRCEGCGAQQLVPGDPNERAVTTAEFARSPRDEDPIAAAAMLIAENPGKGPKVSATVAWC